MNNKSQDFEEKLLMRQPLEGQLSKYTNVVKGWQNRWFVLNPEQGKLNYYEKEEHKKLSKPTRGCVSLVGAVVCPSEEDSQTFTINAVNGEGFRLKASDAKERQCWVNRLRATAEMQTDLMLNMNPGEIPFNDNNNNNHDRHANIFLPRPNAQFNVKYTDNKQQHKLHNRDVSGNLSSCHHQINNVCKFMAKLHHLIEDLPQNGLISPCDQDLLLLKSCSKSAMLCLQECSSILTEQTSTQPITSILQQELISSSQLGDSLIDTSLKEFKLKQTTNQSHLIQELERDHLKQRYNGTEEDTQTDTNTDTTTLSVDDHKPVILELLSQLKLGMDLTKVVLPTFILEKRSLLEMFADSMGHPHLFIKIGEEDTAEGRMVALLKWYLTSFHVVRQGSEAKKPYNPIIGETFHCEWNCAGTRLFYCSEQVSHHPPITAFYFEVPEKGINMEASIWTKSKFMGMSVGVVMVGRIRLRLLKKKHPENNADSQNDDDSEDYIFGLPSAYARSILTTPWMELGDKINFSSANSSASLVFHTKPFYGGRLHKVSGEVKGVKGESVCHISGEWNNSLEFNFANGSTQHIDTSKLTTTPKKVTPIQLQLPHESRRLWKNITEHLKSGDVETATHYKHMLEEEQRKMERLRKQTQIPMQPKYFEETKDSWQFKFPLRATSKGTFLSAFL